jgi:hypothetical protein
MKPFRVTTESTCESCSTGAWCRCWSGNVVAHLSCTLELRKGVLKTSEETVADSDAIEGEPQGENPVAVQTAFAQTALEV